MNDKEKEHRYKLCTFYIKVLNSAQSLHDILKIHKELWIDGLHHPNIGPDQYGMFRTDDIAKMTDCEVFLGDIGGLWTLPLHDWVGTSEEAIITEQYRNHLISNVELLRSLVFDHGLDREKIELAISKAGPEDMNISDVKVLDKEMDVQKLMHFSFKADGVPMRSNLFLKVLSRKDDLLLLPKNWFKGEYIENLHQLRRIPHWTGVGHKDSIFGIRKEFLRREFIITPQTRENNRSVTRSIKR